MMGERKREASKVRKEDASESPSLRLPEISFASQLVVCITGHASKPFVYLRSFIRIIGDRDMRRFD
jgi:hypothetical protein